ncbi:MAG: bifunctional phosphoribosylaminoimidazolecarboxamide formyltransferase/IMP cyclohydrolase PurH [Phycisphaerales bacterium]|nr:MAG: bifunctional phosphoribosylaminoimidazolecarboxamide formyltransferase/IMP cyclohydrolase PurH [Phycisphaerales bacterium]
MSEGLAPVRRALVSVSDKTDLIPFAKALAGHGVQLISTGGTARALEEAGVPVTPIEQLTGFPEIMGGRVKTLHPKVHGGLLALRDDPEHQAQATEHGIEPIDLVCINLYPFEETAGRPGVTDAEAIEQIDIGGPSMIRSAAKNFRSVAVVTKPSQYDRVVTELNTHSGQTTARLRAELAATAFAKTSAYDAAIAAFLSRRQPEAFPPVLDLSYVKLDDLRYGENPHQSGALYRDPVSTGPTIPGSRQLHGKPLGYNNVLDAAAALEVVKGLTRFARIERGASAPPLPAACVVKHTNPCGAATATTALEAVDAALAGDPMAAYGGILALAGTLDQSVAKRLCAEGVFLEVVCATGVEPDALETLKQRWANLRILEIGDRTPFRGRKLEYRTIPGGLLAQDRDVRLPEPGLWTHAAGPEPSDGDRQLAARLMIVVRALSSNAVAIGGAAGGATKDEDGADAFALFGGGAGQMDRVASCRLAVEKAGERARGAIAASDAFFPFPDGPQILIDAGVRLIAHPGGSKRDQDTFDLCDKHGVTCLTTGVRHFRH